MKTEDLIEEIERTRHLSEFEATPRTARDYFSAMPDKEMINRYIEYLINQSESKDLQIKSLEIKDLTIKQINYAIQTSIHAKDNSCSTDIIGYFG